MTPALSDPTSRSGDASIGRALSGTAINRSSHAWVSTVYNPEGLIVSAADPGAAALLGSALRAVLTEFSCAVDGPDWLGGGTPATATGETATGETATGDVPPTTDGVLATGVRIVPGSGSGVPSPAVPDPWSVLEILRTRLGSEPAVSVGLNHLMTSAEVVGGNPLAVGHGRPGLDNYGAAGASTGHGPVSLLVHPRPPEAGRRPRVVVLDTGIGDHPWFRADPAATTVHFADGQVVGPDITLSPARRAAATADSDTAAVDPLLGALPTHVGHGTFIAGLLRQACPAAEIVALTVMSADGFVPEHKLIRALDVLRRRQREAPGWADAVVLSLGYYAETGEDVRYTAGLKDILLDLGRLGVAVFAAAGNDASRRPSYPAALAVDPDFDDPDVLPVVSVAALNPDGSLAPFSNDGPWVTAEAVGVNLVSTSPVLPDAAGPAAVETVGPGGRPRSTLDPDDYRAGYAVWSGTSFAAPLLAGEYLNRLLAGGFPDRNRDRRVLLPLGRRARAGADRSAPARAGA